LLRKKHSCSDEDSLPRRVFFALQLLSKAISLLYCLATSRVGQIASLFLI